MSKYISQKVWLFLPKNQQKSIPLGHSQDIHYHQMAEVGRKVPQRIISPRPLLRAGSVAAGCSGPHQSCSGCLHGKPVPVFNQPHSNLKKVTFSKNSVRSNSRVIMNIRSLTSASSAKCMCIQKQKHHCQRCSLLTFCYSKVSNTFSHSPFWNLARSGLTFSFVFQLLH